MPKKFKYIKMKVRYVRKFIINLFKWVSIPNPKCTRDKMGKL